MKLFRPHVIFVWVPVIALAVIVAEPARAQWEGAEVVILAGSESDETCTRYSLTLDLDDDPHVVWREFPGGRGAIIYATEEGDTWSTPIEVGNDGGTHGDPSIDWNLIENGPVVAFEGSQGGEGDSEIYLATWTGTGFDTIRLTENDIQDYNPTLAVDALGKYHVVCITEVGGEYRLRYLTDASGEPTDQIVDGGDLGAFGSGASPCISASELGVAHIAFRGVWSGVYKIHHVFNDIPGGTDWDWEVMFSANAEDVSSSIAVAASGDIHLAVTGNDCWGCPFKTYYFRKPIYDDWEPYVFIPFGLGLASPSLALDGAGTAHLGLVEVSGNFVTGRLYYASEANGWTPTLIIGVDHATPSLAVGSQGYGHLVCMTGPNTGEEDVLYLKSSGAIVGVDAPELTLGRVALLATPNPFWREVVFSLHGATHVSGTSSETLRIHDAIGRLVRELSVGPETSGAVRVSWDGRDAAGEDVSPGVYFVRLGGDGAAKIIRFP